jgi:hypothetical protein
MELTWIVFSGARNFELLSPVEQEFALNTTVQYAPRAYEWIRDCKATNDGLSIASIGREKSLDDLPQWTWDKVHSYPVRIVLAEVSWMLTALRRWYGETWAMTNHICRS